MKISASSLLALCLLSTTGHAFVAPAQQAQVNVGSAAESSSSLHYGYNPVLARPGYHHYGYDQGQGGGMTLAQNQMRGVRTFLSCEEVGGFLLTFAPVLFTTLISPLSYKSLATTHLMLRG